VTSLVHRSVVPAAPERFPGSLVRAGGWFRFEPAPDGTCALTQEVHVGFPAGLVLPVGEIRRHMREEQENLPRLLA
jgi:hypothetical protein